MIRRIERRWVRALLATLCGLGVPAAGAHAKSHCWKFTEFYSNADGSIQFIEWQEGCEPPGTAEWRTDQQLVQSDAAFFRLQGDLDDTVDTTDTWMLAATPGFAALPGAPTPDFVMPEGFIDTGGDTLRYRSTLDIVTIPPGLMPTDGVRSVHRNLTTNELTVAVNSPINFAGDVGSVNLSNVPLSGPVGPAAIVGLVVLTGAWAAFRAGRSRRSRSAV